jgi:DNA repair protein RadC
MTKEFIKILHLDPKPQLIQDPTISEGRFNASIVHPREVRVPATKESAASFAISHNHPSGKPTPSQNNYEVTHRINQIEEIIRVHMVDHIIIL